MSSEEPSSKIHEIYSLLLSLDQKLAHQVQLLEERSQSAIRGEFSRLENELDVALTTLATMVEGGSSATSHEVQAAFEEITKKFQVLERTIDAKHGELENRQELNEKILKDARQSLFDLRDQVHQSIAQSNETHIENRNNINRIESIFEKEHEKIFQALERASEQTNTTLQSERRDAKKILEQLEANLQKQIQIQNEEIQSRLDEQANVLRAYQSRLENFQQEDLPKHLEKLDEKLLSASKTLENSLRSTEKSLEERLLSNIQVMERQQKDLARLRDEDLPRVMNEAKEQHAFSTAKLFRLVEDNQNAQEKARAEQVSKLEAISAKLEASISQVADRLQTQTQDSIKRVLDDIATLMVAQRGNWNEVIHSAQKGAEKAAEDVRKPLFARLATEVEAVAKKQAEYLRSLSEKTHSELNHWIQEKTGTPWPARLALGGVVGLFLALLALGYWYEVKNSERIVALKQEIANSQDDLRNWLDERLLGLETRSQRAEVVDESVPSSLRAMPAKSTKDFSRGSVLRKEISFTFDGGSNLAAANGILKALRERGIKTTFFVTGEFISKNPEFIREIVRDGHEVANHMLRHDAVVDPKGRYSIFSEKSFLAQLLETERRFEKVTGSKMTKVWRAPYGELNDEVLAWAQKAGYRHVGWTRSGRKNLDTLDWVADPNHPWYRSPSEIKKRILQFEREDRYGLNGAIVLMHLGSERKKDFPHEMLPDLFDDLKKKGYRFVPISALLGSDLAQR